jgi:antitoxin (DNA-binding transcriptional repressor) of toxin-antitoxin stability system
MLSAMNPARVVKVSSLYTGQVKRVTAHEARENWFQLLDEAAEGEVVVIDRDGTALTLQRQLPDSDASVAGVASSTVQEEPGEVIRQLKELRRSNRLPGLSLQEIQEMKEEGRG